MPPPIGWKETEVIMKTVHSVATTRPRVSILMGIMFGLLMACGDTNVYKTDPGHIGPDSIPTDHSCLMGSMIELVRHSSACPKTSSALTSEIQDGLVFSTEQTEALESPCAVGPTPRFEVIFDEGSHSILLDFSQVSASDRFPEIDFEGYVFEVILEEANGLLLDVAVDRETSTLDLDANDLQWDSAHIELNFHGVAYDDQSLLKLDLLFARVPPI